MLFFPDGALIRVALPNWNESTLNTRSRMFTRPDNSNCFGDDPPAAAPETGEM